MRQFSTIKERVSLVIMSRFVSQAGDPHTNTATVSAM